MSAPSDRFPSRDIRARFEERAAIAEYDGGLTREAAEALAWEEVRGEVEGVLRVVGVVAGVFKGARVI